MFYKVTKMFKGFLAFGAFFALLVAVSLMGTVNSSAQTLSLDSGSLSVDADLSAEGDIAVDQCVEVPATPGSAVCICSGSLGCPPNPATCVEIPPTDGSTVCISTSCDSSSETSTSPGAENITPPFDGCELAQTVTTSSDASCSVVATSNGEVLVDRVIETGPLGDTLEVCADVEGL